MIKRLCFGQKSIFNLFLKVSIFSFQFDLRTSGSTMCILSQKFHVFWPLDTCMTWVGINRTKLFLFSLPFIGLSGFCFLTCNFFRPLTPSRWRQIGINTPHFYASREFPKEPEVQNEIAFTSIILLLKKNKVIDTQIFFKKKNPNM